MQQFIRNILCIFFATTLCAADDYVVGVKSVGIGNVWRAGDVTSIHIDVASTKNEVTAAWVQWEVPNADGDTVLWGRKITIPPLGSTSTWLYAPTKSWDTNSTVWTVRLRALEDQEPSKQLGVFSFSPQTVGALMTSKHEGRIAVFGTRQLGLAGYFPVTPTETKPEATIIVSGLQKNDLPDAWPAFLPFDAVVWADTTPEFSYRQANALQHWVERGGHFIISLPTIGDPWSLGLPNAPLTSLIGTIRPTIKEIPLSSLHNIIGR